MVDIKDPGRPSASAALDTRPPLPGGRLAAAALVGLGVPDQRRRAVLADDVRRLQGHWRRGMWGIMAKRPADALLQTIVSSSPIEDLEVDAQHSEAEEACAGRVTDA